MTIPRLAVPLAAVVIGACSREPPRGPAATGSLAYVTNEVSQDLTVIATASDSVVATIPLGARARGVKVSPDGRLVYVALSGSPRCPPTMPDEECARLPVDKSKDGIAEIDAATYRLVRTLPGGSDPEAFDLSPDGSYLYVSNEDAGVASFLELTSGRLVVTVPVGTEPEGVAVSPDGKAVYVTAETDHVVTVLDAASGRELTRITVGRRPRDLAFSPDGRRLYVSAEVDGTVSVIELPEHRVPTVIRLPEGARPMG
ncbi:MAG: beta-propeller fold lactonase family protein, partial [Acidimicrobiales bacterium]